MALRESIRHIYARVSHPIEPFIGDAFASSAPGDLRLMTIGINAYISAPDWSPAEGRPAPGWFSGWFREERHRFSRVVRGDADVLGADLSARPTRFRGMRYAGVDSVFHTNAIKSYLREEDGKRAEQVSASLFLEHAKLWHQELDAMAELGCLPRVIAIFGRPFWSYAWSAFQAPASSKQFASMRVTRFACAGGECRDFANLIEVETSRGPHVLLLVRIRHPVARTTLGSPRWLLRRPELERLIAPPTP